MTRLPMFILMSWPIYQSLLSKPTVYLRGNTERRSISEVSIVRTKDALSSLFKYLTQELRDDEGEPYFTEMSWLRSNQET